jgi:purine-binding chemotaxis protein CheW
MSGALSHVTKRAAELRLAFDRTFAEPVRLDTTLKEDLLAIRVGTQACAMRVSEIAGLFADRKITPVPGGHAALRGIAGFRGAIVPVYDLQILLGHSSSETLRWLVIAAAAPVALAFAGFDGQLRVSRDAIVPDQSRPEIRGYARELVRTENFVGPVVSLASVLDLIKTERSEAAPKSQEEQ